MRTPAGVVAVFSVISASAAWAAADLTAGVWETTYDCPAWSQADGAGALSCPDLGGGGGWTCDNGNGTTEAEQITASANYPGGRGGRGQRHWEGDGTNVNSGGLRILLSQPQQELWLRWYMRWEAGFAWAQLSYDKILYIYPPAGGGLVVALQWADQMSVAEYFLPGRSYASPEGFGWPTIMGGPASDGQWRCFEVHLRTDTDGTNGLAEIWVDGVLHLARYDVNNGNGAHPGWSEILVGSNQSAPANGRCMYVDYDDFAIGNSGRIGCLVPGPAVPPAPAGLRVVGP